MSVLKNCRQQTRPVELKLKSKKKCSKGRNHLVHKYGKGHICTTDGVGFKEPGGKSPLEIVVDSSEGIVPLWKEGSVLHWEFDENSLSVFANSTEIKEYVRELFAEALLRWGIAVPIKFSENSKSWDFRLRIEADNNCSPRGCTLARAFFPDPGRNDLLLFPKMFEQSRKEQIDTIIHELGHVFGLRHFFANISETVWSSEIFGAHNSFSIMNYGAKSELTEADKNDLERLYRMAWSGQLKDINGTDIKFISPYHEML